MSDIKWYIIENHGALADRTYGPPVVFTDEPVPLARVAAAGRPAEDSILRRARVFLRKRLTENSPSFREFRQRAESANFESAAAPYGKVFAGNTR